MDNVYLITGMAVMGLVTFLTRYFSFAFFNKRTVPAWIRYLGTYSPGMIVMILAVYFLKDTVLLEVPHGLPEIIAVALVILLHCIWRNVMVSIFVPTVLYMFLVQTQILNQLFFLEGV